MLQSAVAGRYEVVREIGRGGMAAVFLARAHAAGEAVAIKVLRPEFARVVGVERFLREIVLHRRLRHAHILPLLDTGHAGALPFYVMPFAAGDSLQRRLERAGPLPLAEALAITTAVAAALDYAHAQNIVHRDIKPANILFDGTRPTVSDFGVARAVVAAGGDALSTSGLLVGTPEYMSPEQADGGRALDGRSDLYGLGCVVYEMLAGGPPFTGPSVQAILARHLREPPPSLRSVRSEERRVGKECRSRW